MDLKTHPIKTRSLPGVGAERAHWRIRDTKRIATIITSNWREDSRLTSGYAALKSKLIVDLGARHKQVGWKLGFGSPTGLRNLEIDAPLAGYLLAEHALPNGARVDISSWVKPVGETEIALYFGRDVPPGSSTGFVMDSVTAVGPAIELADLEFAPTDPTKILATDIFQKNYILGARDESSRAGDISGLVAQITMPNGHEVVVTELEELTGKIPSIATHCAEVVGELSGGIKNGEFLIIGSIVPPIALTTGDHFKYALGKFPPLTVSF